MLRCLLDGRQNMIAGQDCWQGIDDARQHRLSNRRVARTQRTISSLQSSCETASPACHNVSASCVKYEKVGSCTPAWCLLDAQHCPSPVG